jgi:hypothetical protein
VVRVEIEGFQNPFVALRCGEEVEVEFTARRS